MSTRASALPIVLASAVLAAVGAGAGCERRRVARTFADAGPPPGIAGSGVARDRDAGSADAQTPACPGSVGSLAPIAIEFDAIDAVDILFVVDDSSTMAAEQALLPQHFTQLLASLTRPRHPLRAPRSVHLGVVSGDLGLEGVDGVTGCQGSGKAAALQHASPDEGACARNLPTFLSFVPASEDPIEAAKDLGCLVQLGTSGCGVQQPLEVTRRAVGRAFNPEQSQADKANVGFLRADEGDERSVLAVIVVSDKDDCSLLFPPSWAEGASFDSGDGALRAQQMRVHCARSPDAPIVADHYLPAFDTRGDFDRQFVFAAITGIPRFTNAAQTLLDARDDPAPRDAFYDDLLADPRMQYLVDDRGTDSADDDTLAPACEGNQGLAWPARRLVEMASGSGANGFVGSICDHDYTETLEAVRQRIAELMVGPCLAQPLQRGGDGLVACELIWTLPPGTSLSPDSNGCDDPDFPYLQSLPQRVSGETRCRVAQLEVAARDGGLGVVPTENDGQRFDEGWFYDDFSSDTARLCPGQPRRVALGTRASPPRSVRVTLECQDRALHAAGRDCRPPRAF